MLQQEGHADLQQTSVILEKPYALKIDVSAMRIFSMKRRTSAHGTGLLQLRACLAVDMMCLIAKRESFYEKISKTAISSAREVY